METLSLNERRKILYDYANQFNSPPTDEFIEKLIPLPEEDKDNTKFALALKVLEIYTHILNAEPGISIPKKDYCELIEVLLLLKEEGFISFPDNDLKFLKDMHCEDK